MDMREIMTRLDEAGRVGTAVRLDEIPPKYKHLKVIGRGTTAVILEKDPSTVLVFTRDQMKVEYLRDHDIATYVDEYEARGHHVRGMSELPIIVMQMPKLEKLDTANKRKVKALIEDFLQVRRSSGEIMARNSNAREQAIHQILNHYSDQDEHLLAPVCNWLMNYSIGQYRFDLHPGNFMQTADGRIVVLDPVVSEELMDLIKKGREERASYRDQMNYGGGPRYGRY